MKNRQKLIVIAGSFLLMGCGLGKTNSNEETSLKWVKRLQDITWPVSESENSRIDVYFKYNQTVNGYEVTGRWRPFDEKSETGAVLLKFRNKKTGATYQYKNYKYHSYDTDKVSFAEDFNGHKNDDIHYFNYTSPDRGDPFKESNGNSPLGYFSPFQFLDIDFDGKDELIISDWYQGQAGNNYEVFKLTNKGLHRLDYMPLSRLTNMDRIDMMKKTISVVCFDGASDGATFFFSHKMRKDKITDVPYFYSDCASRFSFEEYNFDLGVPFVLDSITERVEKESIGEQSYRAEGQRIVGKEEKI